METTDNANGFRQIPGTRISLAVSKSNNKKLVLNVKRDIPAGHRWATQAEACAEVLNTTQPHSCFYYGHEGWNGFTWNGVYRQVFYFSDSTQTNECFHAWANVLNNNKTAAQLSSLNGWNSNFAGLVCIAE
jgi:hypothetical protein